MPIVTTAGASRFGASINAALLAVCMLSACGGGGETVAQARVESVSSFGVLEGDAGLRNMVLTVRLSKPLLAPMTLTYHTSTAGPGVPDAAGFATPGASCGAGVDHIAVSPAIPASVMLPAGIQVVAVSLPITCGDAAFEPNEVFRLHWSAEGASGDLLVGIINDDPGGLNSPGVATVLGGAPAFGRDTHPFTNSDIDGARGFSFADTVNGGCRSDLVTGLTWAALDSSAHTHAAISAVVASTNAASLCGFSDWRLPGAEELASLVDHTKVSPAALNADADASLASWMVGKHWSADSRAGSINDQLVVDFSSQGEIGFLARTSAAQLRLVRGTSLGDPCNALRFTVHGDGTVSDPRTGLMWKQCPEGLAGAACDSGMAIDTSTTDPVLQLALVNGSPALAGSGYADWRIPSRNELASLVCRNAVVAPLVNAVVFPGTDAMEFLASTGNPFGLWWFVDFGIEGVIDTAGVGGKRLRLVRAGQ